MGSSAVGEGQLEADRRRMIPSLGNSRLPANPVSATVTIRRNPSPVSRFMAVAALLALPGCGMLGSAGTSLGNAVSGTPAVQAGQEGFVRGFLGHVAADEPRAALNARNVLSAGGSAADAAVAAGLTMAVTLPSRAGLGGGGACLLFHPRRNEVEAVLFPPGAREAIPAGADRPAAVPMLARGLFALHARAGRRPFEELLGPAEQAARLGVEVSRAFATDLAAVSGPLFADPWAAAAFAGPGGRPLAVGERMVQADLGATLGILRTAGVGDLHQGGLARRVEETSAPAGGGLTAAEMRASVPRVVPPLQQRVGNDIVSFLPAEIAGGQAAASAFAALAAGGAAPEAAPMPAPASTALLVVDRDGMAVACAFTMNNLFGTGRVAPGTGILLAAAPGIGQVTPAPLAAGIAHNASLRAFRAAAAGSGQQGAPIAVATALSRMLRGQDAVTALAAVPEPGRGVAVGCPAYLPGRPELCTGAVDARGAGLALGASDR
jgi:gamma-glutamyltranspeptidase/glutathione hydrolase